MVSIFMIAFSSHLVIPFGSVQLAMKHRTLGRKVAGSVLIRGAVLSLSKTLHSHCLVLVTPGKPSQNDIKSVDRDVKPQTKQTTKNNET